jgi:predicted phage terminase large subunit-like protein
MANVFKEVLEGKKKRVIINIAPRHGKSELTSYLLPAWWLGHKPESKIMMVTHTEDLSAAFGRRIRNLIDSEEYAEIFPETAIAKDAKGSGSWASTKGGTYYAAGVGGAIAGRGADLLLIDDPHSEQSIRANPKLTFDSAWQWYQTGPRQRLQWGGAIIVVMTRWGRLDLTGKLIDHASKNPDGDQWEVIEFPAIMPSGNPLWPEKWPLEELNKIKATIDPRYWQSQYMQQPTAEEGALVKRNWWKQWTDPKPPTCDYVIQSWDTAHEAKTSADYSAYTCWGVFNRENDDGVQVPNIILLDAFKDRMEFPELKKTALKHYKDRNPDSVLVERKASGAPLIQELRAMGVPAIEFTPSRGRAGVANDKTARLNAVSDMFSSGMVWAPDTVWAKEVIEEIASFPAGEHDDYVDSTVQALMRIRAGGLVRLPSDEEDGTFTPRRAAYY